ncbi:unnamed protein product [Strongylus vulgaris]|uniref:Uncharacterized protein n=1 Tax=Strongylus vulgaris TaxID=40348 RepID=A0A3P7J294_STRVU|nr:unnamed protein product [Strongylus vulgaris]
MRRTVYPPAGSPKMRSSGRRVEVSGSPDAQPRVSDCLRRKLGGLDKAANFGNFLSLAQHVNETKPLHTTSHLRRLLKTRVLAQEAISTKRTRQRPAMEIVSCSAAATSRHTSADLHSLLEAAGRINYQFIALY